MNETEGSKPRVYVSAFFCQDVIKDNRGILSAIRITDAFIVNPLFNLLPDGTPNLNSEPVYPPLEVSLVLIFRSDQPGKFTVTLRGRKPNGDPISGGFESIEFETKGQDGGYTLNIRAKVPVQQDGVSWFEVYVDRDLATKVPLIISRGPSEETSQFRESSPLDETSKMPSR